MSWTIPGNYVPVCPGHSVASRSCISLHMPVFCLIPALYQLIWIDHWYEELQVDSLSLFSLALPCRRPISCVCLSSDGKYLVTGEVRRSTCLPPSKDVSPHVPGSEANFYHHHVYLYQLLLNGWMCVHLSVLFSVSRTIDIIIKQYWYIAGTMFYCIVGKFDTPRRSHLKAKWSTSTYQRREGGRHGIPPLLDTCSRLLDCKKHHSGYFMFIWLLGTESPNLPI